MDLQGSTTQGTYPLKQGAYLLRYWQEDETGPMRFMLRSVATGEREMFQDVAMLIARLEGMLVNEKEA